MKTMGIALDQAHSVAADLFPFELNAASRDLLNPLAPPGGCIEGVREILCLMHNLTVAELHNTHCICGSPLVGDCVFRDPEITFSENLLDVETRAAGLHHFIRGEAFAAHFIVFG